MSAVTDLIGNATSSDYTAPTKYNTWQPQYTTQADNSFYNAASGNVNNVAATTPYWQSYLNATQNNPYQTPAQTAANNAGTAYTTTGNTAVGNSQTLSDNAMQLLSAGQSVWNTANDPQNALYNRTVQQLTDQTNAQQAARGITNSGYGADLTNEALGNFNIDWQNNQLQRQALGEQTLANATSGYGNAISTAGQVGNAGATDVLAGGAVPLSTYNSGLQTQAEALNNYSTGSQSNLASLSALLNYMGLGAQQSNAQGNFDEQYWKDQNAYTSVENAQNAAMWGDIGNIFQNPMDLSGISFMGMGINYGSGAGTGANQVG